MDKKPVDALSKYREQLSSVKAGTVTAIKSQRDAGRCSIYIDGEFGFGLARSILEVSPLSTGSVLNEDEQRKLIETDFRYKARAVAFNFLSFRSRSRKELTRRLNRYSGNATFVDGLVDEMATLGHIDDRQFASRFVEARHRLKGHGPSRLRSDLIRKGVAGVHIDEALDQINIESLDERAEDILRRRWEVLSKLPQEKRRNRAMGFLLRRGYDYGVAYRVYAKLENESFSGA